MKRQRKHGQDILDKLEEGRKNKQDIDIDYKNLCEDGFDANNGRVHPNNCCIVKAVEGLEYQITPPSPKGEWE
jgi:hypothetical protein